MFYRVLALGIMALIMGCQAAQKAQDVNAQKPKEVSPAPLLTNHRQLTFSGRRSGEGYFSADGQWMVFQSERGSENPFYQIFLMDLETGQTRQISPGHGKTTCSWIHPSKKKILFASTHLDPEARKKQKAELAQRESGQTRRYSWDYDEHYDLFEASPEGKISKRLTKAKGYDAEGSYSPNGQWIAFASNRHAYTKDAPSKLKEKMSKDPSYAMEIYIMRTDGTGLKRLTNAPGYDGGPFFSPDGQRITWRRFAEDGHTAEIFTMNIDGSDQQQITRLNAMSWAPFYHPSGDYLIFTTNLHGYSNFELYIVDVAGKRTPVRVTNLPGFDGLPVFLPNKEQVAWSRKGEQGESQIYIGDWNDPVARELLQLPKTAPKAKDLSPEIRIADLRRWVEYLASSNMKGRATGSLEEKKYQQTIRDVMVEIGLTAGARGEWFDEFEFVKQVKVNPENSRWVTKNPEEILPLSEDWLPLASSAEGEFKGEDLTFVGYGIVAPQDGEASAYNSYEGVNVEGQWVLMFRDIPADVSTEQRAHLFRYARPDHKVMMAKQRGARGVIFISGPRSKFESELIRLEYDRASGTHDIPVLSLKRSGLQKVLQADTKVDFESLQKRLDLGEKFKSQRLQTQTFSLNIALNVEKGVGRNLIGEIEVNPKYPTLFIGAHGDHLGEGHSSSSLMSNEPNSEVHHGADDNASGVAGVLEVAHWLSYLHSQRKITLRHNLKFAIWSGEELGNLGSSAYLKHLTDKQLEQISAYINLDMIGRLDENLSVQGIGSSEAWDRYLERMSVEKVISVRTQKDPYLPTDAMSFYLKGIPVVNFFTGAHGDYHKPTDTPEKINYQGLAEASEFIGLLTQKVAASSKKLPYTKVDRTGENPRRGFRIFLGTIPDYTQEGVKGVRLQGVVKGGPAEQAGLKGGDVIVQFSGHKIESLYDYVYTLQVVKPGEATSIKVVRGEETLEIPIVPTTK